MGNMTVLGYMQGVREGWWSLEYAVRAHLTGNFFPPLPANMTGACVRAIKKANKGEWDKRVRLPEGRLYKGKYKTAPVDAVIEQHRLEFFLDAEEY